MIVDLFNCIPLYLYHFIKLLQYILFAFSCFQGDTHEPFLKRIDDDKIEASTEQTFYTTLYENVIDEGERRQRKKGIVKIR